MIAYGGPFDGRDIEHIRREVGAIVALPLPAPRLTFARLAALDDAEMFSSPPIAYYEVARRAGGSLAPWDDLALRFMHTTGRGS